MKEPTQEQKEAHQRAVIVGGAKGFLGGLGVALPASYLLYRRWPYYRQLQPSLKAFGVILVAVPAFVISAERAGLRYERERWDDLGTQELETIHERERRLWEGMSPKDLHPRRRNKRMEVGLHTGDRKQREQ